MPIVVRVVSQEDYTKWVAQQKGGAQGADANKQYPPQELISRGQKTYESTCAVCHGAKGEGNPALKAPALHGSKTVTGPKEAHIDTVLNGRPGTAMAPFKEQMNDTDIAAVISYERNSWGNKSGIVQPAEVKARRK
jgi:cytochrome c oxidase subunit 2